LRRYDYIIVGAGSAGCVLAERLSADPKNQVLLLEEGQHKDNWLVKMPRGIGKLLSDTHRVSTFEAQINEKQHQLWLRGRMLGGTSSVNGALWLRGERQTYDSLMNQGIEGWSWNDMLPCFRSIESHESGKSDLHGDDGPIPVRTHPRRSRMTDALIASGLVSGLPLKQDVNDGGGEGVGYIQHNIGRDGRRRSAAAAFLAHARQRPNLTIEAGVRANRFIFEGRRAIAASCTRQGQVIEYHANREIISCAGALVSPQLLLHSGIGEARQLRALGINTIADSPQVGKNLQEHLVLALRFHVKHWRDSHNREFGGWRLLRNVLSYLSNGQGIFATGIHEVAAQLREGETWAADTRIMYTPFSTKRDNPRCFEELPGVQLQGFGLYPESRGDISIVSPDFCTPPRIRPNYLSAPHDQAMAVAVVRHMRKLMNHPALRDLIIGETDETASAQTDEEVLELFRRYGTPGFHAIGTCAMGGTDAVLDSRLRVRGVEGLRVVDCSIFPHMVSGHTNAPVMAAAWHAATMILEDNNPKSEDNSGQK